MATETPSLTSTLLNLRHELLFSYIQNPTKLTMSVQNLLKTIISTKNQLCFHATLIRRHSQAFLFFLDKYQGAPHLKNWEKFNPYRRHCLRILVAVFEDAIEEVERDEEILTDFLRNPFVRCFYGLFGNGKGVEDAILRWSISLRNRRLGRLILDSWTQETNAAGEPEGSGSCNINDVVHLMAAVWEEEWEKEYIRSANDLEEAGQSGSSNDSGGGNSGDEGSEGEDNQEEGGGEEEFEAWRPFMGPSCLKRKDELHLVYRR
ncbi:hypothetical protein TWF718_001890 [Orbilia javanica]|uniref:Uncharacterized protein n=1 Tax=Orbilia javanica TaxID=47235 RepID=A0AAN8RNM4_9PEZI